MVDQARLMAQLGLDATPFDAAMGMAQAKASQFGRFLDGFKGTIAGAFSVGAIAAWGRSAIAVADQVSELSEAAGLTTDQFQALAASARANGIADEKLVGIISRLRDVQGKLLQGDEGAAKMFERLGLSAKEVSKANVADLLLMVAQASRNANQDGALLAATMDILGAQNAPKLQAALRELADNGWTNLIAKQREFGQVMDGETIGQLKDAQDQIERLHRRLIIWAGNALSGISKSVSAEVAGIVSALNGTGWQAGYDNAFRDAQGAGDSGANATPGTPAANTTPGGREGLTREQELMKRNADLMFQMRLDELDVTGRIVELEKERARLLEEEGNADVEARSEDFLKVQYERLQIEREITRLRRQSKEEGARGGPGATVDAGRRPIITAGIERFAGMGNGMVAPLVEVQRRHLRVSEIQLDAMRRMADALTKLSTDGVGGYAP